MSVVKAFVIPAKLSFTGEERKVVLREATRADQKVVLRQKKGLKPNADDIASMIEVSEAMLARTIIQVDEDEFPNGMNEVTYANSFNQKEAALLSAAFDNLNGLEEDDIADFLSSAEEVTETQEVKTSLSKKARKVS